MTSKSPYIIVGIDPGSGIKSPTGFTAFATDTLEILYAANIATPYSELPHRIKHISDIFEASLKDIIESSPEYKVVVVIEQFVMQGKGGETLQRLIGSLMGRVPYTVPVFHAQNTTVKLIIGGSGKATKDQLIPGLKQFFLTNQISYGVIEQAEKAKDFDVIDSLAIGVTGWIKNKHIL